MDGTVATAHLLVGRVLVGTAVEGQPHGLEAVHGLGVRTDHDLAARVFRIRNEFALPAGQLRKALAPGLLGKQDKFKSFSMLCKFYLLL